MFEVLVVFIAVVLTSFLESFYLSLGILILVVVLVLPGVYAMFFGAPYLNTSEKRIEAMLSLADLKKSDNVYELGCGDGRIIRKVAARGVELAVGYEFSLPTFLFAYLRNFFLKANSEIRFKNFWKQDYSSADVLVCFLLDRTMKDFEKKIWPFLKKGTRVLSNEFVMPGVDYVKVRDRVYLYVKG